MLNRRKFRILAIAAGLAGQLFSQAKPCFDYEPTQVELVGKIQRHKFPGPPNYESVKAGDRPEVYWLLQLPSPICATSSKPNDSVNAPESEISTLQIIIDDYKKYKNLPGKKVKITGTLMHAITGHHHTKVLIKANTIQPAP